MTGGSAMKQAATPRHLTNIYKAWVHRLYAMGQSAAAPLRSRPRPLRNHSSGTPSEARLPHDSTAATRRQPSPVSSLSSPSLPSSTAWPPKHRRGASNPCARPCPRAPPPPRPCLHGRPHLREAEACAGLVWVVAVPGRQHLPLLVVLGDGVAARVHHPHVAVAVNGNAVRQQAPTERVQHCARVGVKVDHQGLAVGAGGVAAQRPLGPHALAHGLRKGAVVPLVGAPGAMQGWVGGGRASGDRGQGVTRATRRWVGPGRDAGMQGGPKFRRQGRGSGARQAATWAAEVVGTHVSQGPGLTTPL